MGTYRRKFDIVAAILHIASKNPKKTQIMFQANLSFRVLQKYLSELKKASLITFHDETQCYALTTKGRQFINEYKDLSKASKHIEKELIKANDKKTNLEQLLNK